MNDVHSVGGHPGWDPHAHGGDLAAAYRKDLHTYIWGLALAVVLTAVPFALVYWHVMTTTWLWVTIGLLAVVQAGVHFRCFLHINPPHENVDTVLLIIFTIFILIMMSGGTVWILGNLHSRMY